MRIWSTCAFLLGCTFAFASPAIASELTGDLNLFLGQRTLEEDDWEPLDKQIEVGVEGAWGLRSWPVLIATDFLYSTDSATALDTKLTVHTWELAVGPRKVFDVGGVRPYLGAGVELAGVSLVSSAVSDESGDGPGPTPTPTPSSGTSGTSATAASIPATNAADTTLGFWVGGGVGFRLGSRWNLGVGARYSTAQVDLGGGDVDAGGLHYGLTLGFSFGVPPKPLSSPPPEPPGMAPAGPPLALSWRDGPTPTSTGDRPQPWRALELLPLHH